MPVGHGSIQRCWCPDTLSMWVISLACELPLSSLQCMPCRPDKVLPVI